MQNRHLVKNEAIREEQRKLRQLLTEWEEDGCSPSNYHILNGLGERLAEVNRWCGGFQEPQNPVTIGWKAQVGTKSSRGILVVHYLPGGSHEDNKKAIKMTIELAQHAASKALHDLLPDLR